jgi:metallo-beta-lactamase class B
VRGRIEFKFTLGSWETVEVDSAGGDVSNRSFTVPDSGPAEYTGAVLGWRDGTPPPPRAHSTTTSVTVLDTAFVMSQLGRPRRVWIYLPPGYAESHLRYPVLYMHDGQNVFDAATSFAGEWGVDESLDSLAVRGDPGVIVVAVDHGGPRRMDEYSPWRNPTRGGGEGDAYVDFLVKTLKPRVDRTRTRADRVHAGVAGSAWWPDSLRRAKHRPSSAGWVFLARVLVCPSIFSYARRAQPRRDTRIYIVMGGRRTPGVTSGRSPHGRHVARGGIQVVESVVRPDGTLRMVLAPRIPSGVSVALRGHGAPTAARPRDDLPAR